MRLKVALFLIMLALCSAAPHPVHVTVTDIVFDETEKELEIVMRIFIDDLEASVRKAKDQTQLNLLKPAAPETTDQLLWQYLQPRFTIALDGKLQKLKLLGHELDGEALIVYIQAQPVKKFQSVDVKNSVITELYDDQSNLVHVTRNEKIKSLRLMADTPSGKLTFDTK